MESRRDNGCRYCDTTQVQELQGTSTSASILDPGARTRTAQSQSLAEEVRQTCMRGETKGNYNKTTGQEVKTRRGVYEYCTYERASTAVQGRAYRGSLGRLECASQITRSTGQFMLEPQTDTNTDVGVDADADAESLTTWNRVCTCRRRHAGPP